MNPPAGAAFVGPDRGPLVALVEYDQWHPQPSPHANGKGSHAQAILVPPRPNLGPEPMEAAPVLEWWLTVGAVLLLIAGALVMGLRRLKRKLAAQRGLDPDRPRSSRSRRLRTRGCSGARPRFVPSWRRGAERRGLRTTEEIAARPELVEMFGGEQAERLVAFLQAADRAKFAPRTLPLLIFKGRIGKRGSSHSWMPAQAQSRWENDPSRPWGRAGG